MAQAKKMLAGLKRFQEGGEVTDEASPDLAQALAVLESDPSKYKSMYQYLLTKGDIANLNDQNLAKEDIAALGLVHAARMSNTEPEAFIENIRPSLQNLPSRQQDVRPSVMLQGSSGGFNVRMPGMNFEMPYVPATLMGRLGAEADVGKDTVRAGLVAGGAYIPNMGVMRSPVMADVGYRTPVAGGTLDIGVGTGVQNPSMKNTNFMANYSRRFAEGGEVEEFPEEQASMTPSDSARQLMLYRQRQQPRAALPPGVIPETGQADGMYQPPSVASETERIFGMKQRGDRLTLLPKFVPGEGLVAPEMLYDAARAIAAPGAAAQGADVGVPDAVNMAFNFTGAGVGTSAAMRRPTGEGGKVLSMSTLPSGSTAKDDLAKMPKKMAPANESGFFSPTEAAALNLQRKSGSGQAFLNDIMKGENVKSDEIKAMGLDTFLKDKKNVTTAEVQDFIAKNKIKLGETVYGGQIKEDPVGLAKRKEVFDKYEPEIQSLYADIDSMPLYMKVGDRYIANPRLLRIEDNLNDLQLKRDAEADAVYKIPENKDTKFQGYALPSGQNYREIVLTLPDPKDALMSQVKAVGITKDKDKITVNDILQRGGSDKLADNWLKSSQGVYKTRHWDETNPLSHLRVSDRVTDGKKTLLVDEVQSDWHQAGREQGYVDPNKKPFTVEADQYGVYRIKDANGQTFSPYVDGDQMSGFITREAAENAMQNNMTRLPKSQGVPDAPYKDDWYQLALRRAIKEAVDGGYDRVALPTGARVAERFDLSKQADGVFWSPDKKELTVKTKSGDYVPVASGISDQEISKYVGNDVAKRLLSTEQENIYGVGKVHSLLGEELTVGGEGMKKYYDEIYPGYLKKFGKKYGAESGKTTVDVKGKPEPLFYMDITPKMREEFTSGIPMREGGEVRKPK